MDNARKQIRVKLIAGDVGGSADQIDTSMTEYFLSEEMASVSVNHLTQHLEQIKNTIADKVAKLMEEEADGYTN